MNEQEQYNLLCQRLVFVLSEDYPMVHKIINYQDKLLKISEARYDLLQFILRKYLLFVLPEDCSNYVTRPFDSNDQREQVLVKCFNWLGLIEFDDLEIIQGNCTVERNLRFLRQLLDLVESVTDNYQFTMKQQLQKDCNFVSYLTYNTNEILKPDLALFSQDLSSKFKKRKVPEYHTFIKDVEKANQHIQKYKEIINDLNCKIKEQNGGEEIQINNNNTKGNYYSLVNLSEEHILKIKRLGEGLSKLQLLTQQFTKIYNEEISSWIKEIPEGEFSLGKMSTDVFELFNHIEKFVQHVHLVRQMYEELMSNTNQTLSKVNLQFEGDIQSKLSVIEQTQTLFY
ncbi:hypothetical protein ABK040_003435 [Willaertia magna]